VHLHTKIQFFVVNTDAVMLTQLSFPQKPIRLFAAVTF